MSDFRIAEFERQAALFNETKTACETKLKLMAATYEQVLLVLVIPLTYKECIDLDATITNGMCDLESLLVDQMNKILDSVQDALDDLYDQFYGAAGIIEGTISLLENLSSCEAIQDAMPTFEDIIDVAEDVWPPCWFHTDKCPSLPDIDFPDWPSIDLDFDFVSWFYLIFFKLVSLILNSQHLHGPVLLGFPQFQYLHL